MGERVIRSRFQWAKRATGSAAGLSYRHRFLFSLQFASHRTVNANKTETGSQICYSNLRLCIEFPRFMNNRWKNVCLPGALASEMALKALLSAKVNVKLFRSPPLHMKVLKLVDTSRVTSWFFSDNSAKPSVIKHNKTAIISDGHSTAKVVLFKEFASNVHEGGSYIVKGHSPRHHTIPNLEL
ncbi:uncharacterized protein V6R79_025124 [Siganus canaliculatus]